MAQVTETNATVADKSIAGFLSAIKAGVSACSSGAGLFASLLAENKNEHTQIELNEPARTKAPYVGQTGGQREEREMFSETSTQSRGTQENTRSLTSGRSDEQPQQAARAEKEATSETEQAENEDEVVVSEDGSASDAQDVVVQQKAGEEKPIEDEEKSDADCLDELDALLAVLVPLAEKEAAAKTAKNHSDHPANQNEDAKTDMAVETKEQQAIEALSMIQQQIAASDKFGQEEQKGEETGESVDAAVDEIASQIIAFKDLSKGKKAQETLGDKQPSLADASQAVEPGQVTGSGAEKTAEGQTSNLAGKGEGAVSQYTFDYSAEGHPKAAAPSNATAQALGTQNAPGLTEATTKAAGKTVQTDNVVSGGVRTVGSYDFASQLSAVRVSKGGGVGLPHAIEQVAVQLNKAVKEGVDEISIQLKPAELGKIEIKLEVASDKSVTGKVVAENQATLNMLQKDSSNLQRALQEAGLTVETGCLEFSLKDQGQTGQFSHNQNSKESGGQSSSLPVYSEGLSVEATEAIETYYVTPGHVNLRV